MSSRTQGNEGNEGAGASAPRRRSTGARWLIASLVAAGWLPGNAAALCDNNVIAAAETWSFTFTLTTDCTILPPDGNLFIAPPATITLDRINFSNRNNLFNESRLRVAGGVLENRAWLYNGANAVLETFGGTVVNAGQLDNLFVIENQGGLLSNLGTLTNHSTGTIRNLGEMQNHGNLDSRGVIENRGTLSNRGTMFVNEGGLLDNLGNLELVGRSPGGTGSILGIVASTLRNAGVVTLQNAAGLEDFGSSLALHGSALNNLAGASVTIERFAKLDIASIFTPNGRLDSTLRNDGTLTNNGFVYVEGLNALSNAGLLLNNLTVFNLGRISNSGTIENQGDLRQDGTLVNQGGAAGRAGGVFLNFSSMTNTGVISNGGGSGAGNEGAVFNNYVGLFRNNGYFENLAGVSGGGAAVLNNFDGFFVSDAGGVAAELSNDGIINNNQYFVVAANGTVTGTGSYIQAQRSAATVVDGIMVQGAFDCLAGIVYGTANIAAARLHIAPACETRPGHSPGTLTLDGGAAGVDFEGTLEIEIAGYSSYDILRVLGGGIHFGDAAIRFVFEDFAPHIGDTFGFLLGDFDGTYSFSYKGLGAGYGFDLVRDGNGHLGLRVLAAPGDPPGGGVPLPGTLLLTLLGVAALRVSSTRMAALPRPSMS